MATNMQNILAIRAEMYKIEQELAQGDVPHSDQAGLIQFWEDLDEEVFRLEMAMENEVQEPVPANREEDRDSWDYESNVETEALMMEEAEQLRQDKEEMHMLAWQSEDLFC